MPNPPTQDMTGKRFGRLVVTHRPAPPKHRDANGRTMWACECDCGSTLRVARVALLNGDTRSCGCLRQELCATLGKKKGGK